MNDMLRYTNWAKEFNCDISFDYTNNDEYFVISVRNRRVGTRYVRMIKFIDAEREHFVHNNVVDMIWACSSVSVTTN